MKEAVGEAGTELAKEAIEEARMDLVKEAISEVGSVRARRWNRWRFRPARLIQDQCRRLSNINHKSAGACVLTAEQGLSIRVSQRYRPRAGAECVLSRRGVPFEEPSVTHLLLERVSRTRPADRELYDVGGGTIILRSQRTLIAGNEPVRMRSTPDCVPLSVIDRYNGPLRT